MAVFSKKSADPIFWKIFSSYICIHEICSILRFWCHFGKPYFVFRRTVTPLRPQLAQIGINYDLFLQSRWLCLLLWQWKYLPGGGLTIESNSTGSSPEYLVPVVLYRKGRSGKSFTPRGAKAILWYGTDLGSFCFCSSLTGTVAWSCAFGHFNWRNRMWAMRGIGLLDVIRSELLSSDGACVVRVLTWGIGTENLYNFLVAPVALDGPVAEGTGA